jgi:hypothetical protein
MRKRMGPPLIKRSYYVQGTTANAFKRFTLEMPSEAAERAFVVWMGLPPAVREEVMRVPLTLPVAGRVEQIRRIVRDGMTDMLLAEYIRTLTKAERARMMREARGRAKR